MLIIYIDSSSMMMMKLFQICHAFAIFAFLASCYIYTSSAALDARRTSSVDDSALVADIQALAGLHNFTRYRSCPLHSIHNFEFACHHEDLTKTKRIFDYTIAKRFPVATVDEGALLSRMVGLTLAMIGDSLVKNQFVSLGCRLWDLDRRIDDKLIIMNESLNIFAVSSPMFNIQLQYSFSSNLVNIHPTSQLSKYLGTDGYSKFMKAGLYSTLTKLIEAPEKFVGQRFNLRRPKVLLLGTGVHFGVAKYNKSVTNFGIFDTRLFRTAIGSINDLVNISISRVRQKPQHSADLIQVVWKSVQPRHFYRGDWKSGGHCGAEKPCPWAAAAARAASYVEVSLIIEAEAKRAGFAYLDLNPYTLDRCDAHVGNLTTLGLHGRIPDCVHYCVPGVPDIWNKGLLDLLGRSAGI